MADNRFRVNLEADKHAGGIDRSASTYYGPCRKSVVLTQNGKTLHNPREFFKNHGLKPEANYILLGEVEKELKAVNEKTQKVQVKHPQQLNVSNLLEELMSSKKWQILNSSTRVYAGTKKRPAPQAPTQQQKHIHGKQQIGPAAGKPRRLLNVSNNFTPSQNKFAHNPEAPHKVTSGFDEYLNAGEVHKLYQSENKGTYDITKWSEQSAPVEANFSSPVDSTSPLVPPCLTPTTRPNETTSKTSSQQKKFSDNFLLQSRHEVEKSIDMKRSEAPRSEGTIKLLPSDIRKHRIWLSLNPGTKANQTTSGLCYDVKDNPSKAALRPISPWNGLHHTKDPFPRSRDQMGYKRFSNGNRDSIERWQEQILKKSSKLCGAHFNTPAPWLAAIIMLNIAIGFILGFIAAWFGRTAH